MADLETSAVIDAFMDADNEAAARAAIGAVSAADVTSATNSGINSTTSATLFYCSKTGNDSTGNGTKALPYLTTQKVLDEAIAYSNTNSKVVGIHFGVGFFDGASISTLPYQGRLSIFGAGAQLTYIGQITIAVGISTLKIVSNRSLRFANITRTAPAKPATTAAGINGAAGASGSPPQDGSAGGNSDSGETGTAQQETVLVGLILAGSFVSVGGAGGDTGPGGTGGTGGSSSSTGDENGANGGGGGVSGDGGTGGAGGKLTAFNCAFVEVNCAGGAGGDPGAAGIAGGPGNGAGSGEQGLPGADGSQGATGIQGADGEVRLYHCTYYNAPTALIDSASSVTAVSIDDYI